jgi:UDP-galactose transporter B1
MSVHHVGPFDLMYNIQLGKTILAGVALLVLNQVHIFVEMCTEMGFLLVALGLSGALGQVFIFVTISKFGALTCSIIGLARKVATLCASIYFYGHVLNKTQVLGLIICIGSMVANFGGKKGHHGGGGHGNHEQSGPSTPKALYRDQETNNGDGNKDNKSETEHDADDNDEEKPLIIGQKNVEMTTITL